MPRESVLGERVPYCAFVLLPCSLVLDHSCKGILVIGILFDVKLNTSFTNVFVFEGRLRRGHHDCECVRAGYARFGRRSSGTWCSRKSWEMIEHSKHLMKHESRFQHSLLALTAAVTPQGFHSNRSLVSLLIWDAICASHLGISLRQNISEGRFNIIIDHIGTLSTYRPIESTTINSTTFVQASTSFSPLALFCVSTTSPMSSNLSHPHQSLLAPL